MRLFQIHENVTIDNRNGIGAVPNNLEIDYFGLRVRMLPSIFLKLAAPMGNSDLSFFKDALKNGKSFGAPFLIIRLPEQWQKGDFKKLPHISTHEGRHRMAAINEVYGDIPVETHLFFTNGVRNRDLTPELIVALNKGIIPENGKTVVRGPLFNLG